MLLAQYKNGNYTVRIYDDGTKIRFNDLDNLTPDFAESIDCTITMKCDGGCQYCLTSDNFVLTEDGELPIEDVVVGSHIVSVNTQTHQKEINTVVNTSKREYKGDLIVLTFENGKQVVCTPNHKIYTTNRGYVMAKDLQMSDDFIGV